MITVNDWLMLMCLSIGWIQGFYLGWVLWRKPNLKYKGVDDVNG